MYSRSFLGYAKRKVALLGRSCRSSIYTGRIAGISSQLGESLNRRIVSNRRRLGDRVSRVVHLVELNIKI